jgi:hypothetical protein
MASLDNIIARIAAATLRLSFAPAVGSTECSGVDQTQIVCGRRDGKFGDRNGNNLTTLHASSISSGSIEFRFQSVVHRNQEVSSYREDYFILGIFLA